MKAKMTFVKVQETPELVEEFGPNFLGWEKIEILEFNYDGKGNALAKDYLEDGTFSFGEYCAGVYTDKEGNTHPGGLRNLLWGGHYKLVDLLTEGIY